MIPRALILAAAGRSVGGYTPNAVKFDGANDYLTRGADLTGIADSKSGIFSAWVRLDGGDAATFYLLSNLYGSLHFDVRRNSDNKFWVTGKNSAGAAILNISTTSAYLSSAKWVHVLAAWDLAATTSSIYIIDVADQTATTRTNDTIDYVTATPDWAVGSRTTGVDKLNGALSELYFAPGQYLDFSNSTNRRKFIDASGLPVSLGADGSTPTGSQPAIYLKGDSAAFGTNSGSGGNFTVNGTLEKASTTPATLPAYNAVKFDGASDYLSKSGLTASTSGHGTCSFWARFDATGPRMIISAYLAGYTFYVECSSSLYFFIGDSSAGAKTFIAYTAESTLPPSPVTRHVLMQWDTNQSAGNKVFNLYVDGVSMAVTKTDASSAFTYQYGNGSLAWRIGEYAASSEPYSGTLSEFYLATTGSATLDITVQANREKFILNGAPVSLGADGSTPTGVAPAIYLPNRAALVGTNAGSGGNFTVNGAPKDANSTPVYCYAEPSTFDGTNDYLAKATALSGSASKQFTFSCWVRIDTAQTGMFLTDTVASIKFQVYMNAVGTLQIDGWNSAGTLICSLYKSGLLPTASPVWRHILVSVDLATSVGQMYLDNAAITPSTSSLTNDNIAFNSNTTWAVGADPSGSYRMARSIADLWFNTTYLDISNSSNRAKFIDQTTLRPVPLGAKGELPTGSQPLLYLGRDYANFHKNLGSGGDFTVTGALARGTTSPSDVRA